MPLSLPLGGLHRVVHTPRENLVSCFRELGRSRVLWGWSISFGGYQDQQVSLASTDGGLDENNAGYCVSVGIAANVPSSFA
jgi:hypothetical protein